MVWPPETTASTARSVKDGLEALAGGHRHKAVVPIGVDGGVDELAGNGVGGALLLLGLGLLFQALALLLAGQNCSCIFSILKLVR